MRRFELVDYFLLTACAIGLAGAVLAATGILPDIHTIKLEQRRLDNYISVKKQFSPNP
jgi:hypothetical protein